MDKKVCDRCGAFLRSSQGNNLCSPCQKVIKEEEGNQLMSITTDKEPNNVVIHTNHIKHKEILKTNLFTIKEMTHLFQYSERQIRNMIKGGKIRAFRLPGGRKWFIPEDQSERFSGFSTHQEMNSPVVGVKENFLESISEFSNTLEMLKLPKKVKDFMDKSSQLCSASIEENSEVQQGFMEFCRYEDEWYRVKLAPRSTPRSTRRKKEFALSVSRLSDSSNVNFTMNSDKININMQYNKTRRGSLHK